MNAPVCELDSDPLCVHMDIIKVLLEMSLWGLLCLCIEQPDSKSAIERIENLHTSVIK